jgi:hypothetical protein
MVDWAYVWTFAGSLGAAWIVLTVVFVRVSRVMARRRVVRIAEKILEEAAR